MNKKHLITLETTTGKVAVFPFNIVAVKETLNLEHPSMQAYFNGSEPAPIKVPKITMIYVGHDQSETTFYMLQSYQEVVDMVVEFINSLHEDSGEAWRASLEGD